MKKIYFAFLLNCIAILNTVAQPGALDFSFNSGTGANSTVYTSAIQADGKIIIGGDFTSYNDTTRNDIARLNNDGSIDFSFNLGTGANSSVYSSAIQTDGKIIIGGAFTSYNGTAIGRIARLNSNGTLDTTFNPGTGASASILTIAIQSDGKIIIGGQFTSYNATARNFIARLNSDGSLDLGFNPGTGTNNTVNTAVIQSNGKIIIGGGFVTFNGTGRKYIARLNNDGSLDLSFNQGTGADFFLQAIALQSDGKIIIGGYFTTYNGTARKSIARLMSDGSLDASFNPGIGTGASTGIWSVAIQGNGKIVIGGDFISYNGTTRNSVALLNSNGTLDFNFNPGTGANYTVYTTAIQSDGKIIIGGTFDTYNGTTVNYIARLHGRDDFNTITGVCYLDYNQNNIQDNGEPGFPNEMVSSSSSTYASGSVTNNQGVFNNVSDTGSITTVPKPYPYYTITPTQHTSNFSSYKNTDTINFAFVPIIGQDLRITIIPLNAARTGRDVNYALVYENVGTKTMSGSVYLTMNSGLTFVSANPAYSSINGDTLQWTYSNLVPNESRSIDVTLTVPVSATIGTTLLPSARIEPVATDTTPNNNYFALEQIVTGAYDPNDKTMLQGDDITDQQVADGDYLDYLIRFQNTGNDTAFVVVIRDTLDNKLDWNSFEMVSSSHNYSVAIRDGKNIAWTFDNILLPDSNVDEPGSHGYICYRIKPKNNLQLGDIISNTAHIFFDYNVPVATNTAITTVSSPVNISSNPAADKFIIYPNPAEDKITVLCHNPNQGQLEIVNVLGAVVLQASLQNSITEIDISSLNKGIYFVKTVTGFQPGVKLIVQ